MQVQQVMEELLDLLEQGASIQQVIDAGAVWMDAPVLVSDSRYRLLYMSETVETDVKEWKDAQRNRFIENHILDDMAQHGVPEQLHRQRKLSVAGLPNGFHAARYPLVYDRQYRGFVGMYDYHHPFSKEDLSCLTAVGKVIGSLLYTDAEMLYEDGNVLESLLHQLIHCETQAQASMLLRRHPAITFLPPFLLCSIQPGKDSTLPLFQVQERFRSELPQHISFIEGGRIVVLFELTRFKQPACEQLFASIETFCAAHRCRAGVSFSFEDLSFMPFAYQQTVLCLRDAPQAKTVVPFESILVQTVASVCTQAYPKEFFIHPIIGRVIRHDQQYHLDYLRTLTTFIQCAGNLKATAARLGIHYNTIKYRMSVIENIAGEKITDQGDLLHLLYLSSQVYGWDHMPQTEYEVVRKAKEPGENIAKENGAGECAKVMAGLLGSSR